MSEILETKKIGIIDATVRRDSLIEVLWDWTEEDQGYYVVRVRADVDSPWQELHDQDGTPLSTLLDRAYKIVNGEVHA